MPIIPTGHAHTLRRIPPSADAGQTRYRELRAPAGTGSPHGTVRRRATAEIPFSPFRAADRGGPGENKNMPRPSLYCSAVPDTHGTAAEPGGECGRVLHYFCSCCLPSRLYCRHRNFTGSRGRCGSRTITAGSEFHRPRSTIERLNYRTPEREDSHGARPQPGTLRTGSQWGAYPAARRQRIRDPAASEDIRLRAL